MLLKDAVIQRSLQLAKAAFPRFAGWQYNNEVNEEYSGFALWGEFVPDSGDGHYFITFDTFRESWRGHLSIGQHMYFWSRADFGHAYLVDTDSCATLEDAISKLKKQMAELFVAFLGFDPFAFLDLGSEVLAKRKKGG